MQFPLLISISLDKVLDLPEKHFHKKGLWACPATPDSTECRGEQDYKHKKSNSGKTEQDEILWPKDLSKNDELSLKKVK